jgi:hypothetical protein
MRGMGCAVVRCEWTEMRAREGVWVSAFTHPQLLNALQKLSKPQLTKPLIIETASRLGAVKPERSCHGGSTSESKARETNEGFDRWWRWRGVALSRVAR